MAGKARISHAKPNGQKIQKKGNRISLTPAKAVKPKPRIPRKNPHIKGIDVKRPGQKRNELGQFA